VFVSSTCWDLVDVRREVEEHIRGLGLQPVLSDRSTSDFEVSGDKHSIESCLVNVRNSDVFVCILSQRYGPKLGGYGYPDISATHLEYREAKNAGRQIFLYARDQLVAEHGSWRRDKAAFTGRWVKTSDVQIFDLLDEHATPPASEPRSNWYTAFRDSVELKQVITRDLRAQSRPAILQRLIDNGRVPFFTIVQRPPERHGTHVFPSVNVQKPHVVVQTDVQCLGGCIALHVEGWSVLDGCDHRWPLGTLPSGGAGKFSVFLPEPTEAEPNPSGSACIRHETAYGFAVVDTFARFSSAASECSAGQAYAGQRDDVRAWLTLRIIRSTA
jgi:hypothetical protein